MTTLRNCTVASSKMDAPKTFLTSASTLSELKSDFQAQGIEYNSDMKVMLRTQGGQGTSITDTSALPSEDFVIFITPKKVKSGK